MKKKTVIITGGTRGLGEAFVQGFLSDDQFNVVTCGRKKSAFIERTEESSFKDRFWFSPLDVSRAQDAEEFVVEARKRFGSIDILINNAGVAADGVLALQQTPDIDEMLDVNLRGSITMARACSREMLTRRWGRIINITSVVGKTGFRGLSVYALTKAGLDGFTRGLARELGHKGITVNSVAPGLVATAMTHGIDDEQRAQIVRRTPVGRLGRCEDVVPLVRFLCSDQGAFITGQTIFVDGGLTA